MGKENENNLNRTSIGLPDETTRENKKNHISKLKNYLYFIFLAIAIKFRMYTALYSEPVLNIE